MSLFSLVAAASPAAADVSAKPACAWQPVVGGLRHLRSAADLAADELGCGIVDPVDLSPAVAAAIGRIHRSLRAAPGGN